MKNPFDNLSESAVLQNGTLFSFSAFAACRIAETAAWVYHSAGRMEWVFFAFSAVFCLLEALFFTGVEKSKCRPSLRLTLTIPLSVLSLSVSMLPGLYAAGLLILTSLVLPPALKWLEPYYPKADFAAFAGGAAAGLLMAVYCPAPLYRILLAFSAVFLPFLMTAHKEKPCLSLLFLLFLNPLHTPAWVEVPSFPFPVKQQEMPSLQSIYNTTILTLAEYGKSSAEIRYISPHKDAVTPHDLAVKILRESADPAEWHASLAADSRRNASAKQKQEQRGPEIILLAPGMPLRFADHYWYTQECFAQLHAVLPPNGILALQLPDHDDFSEDSLLAVAAALQTCFRKVIRIHFPGPVLLASDIADLTADPAILDDRAVKERVYERMFAPQHLLQVSLPLYQLTEEEQTSFAKELLSISPNRVAIPWGLTQLNPADWQNPIWLAVAGIFLALYCVIRYAVSWKPERKKYFRLAETGFYLTGILLFGCLLRAYAPAQNLLKDFSLFCLVPFFLTACLFRPRKTGVFAGIILPCLLIGISLYILPQSPRFMLIFLSAMTGLITRNILEQAVAAAPGSGSYAPFLTGAGIAFLMMPVLFLLPFGLCLAGGILILLAVCRRREIKQLHT